MTSIPTMTTTESRTDLDPAEAAALLIAVQRGDDEALDDLVRLCEPFVRRCAQRYAWRRADADDIVQEVWVRIMLKADQIRDPRTLIAWLQIVTRRVAARLGHREARQVPPSSATAARARARSRTTPCDATTRTRPPAS